MPFSEPAKIRCNVVSRPGVWRGFHAICAKLTPSLPNVASQNGLAAHKLRKEPQHLDQVLLPVRPLVAARKFFVFMRNMCFLELTRKFAIMLQQRVLCSAVKTQ